MSEATISSDDLLLGAECRYDIAIPPAILNPGKEPGDKEEVPRMVQLRPLTIGVFQLIMKAARNDPGLIPILMIKESLVAPKVQVDQVRQMHVGLIEFLIEHIRQISGLTKKKSE